MREEIEIEDWGIVEGRRQRQKAGDGEQSVQPFPFLSFPFISTKDF
jgi:hypothetical protein